MFEAVFSPVLLAAPVSTLTAAGSTVASAGWLVTVPVLVAVLTLGGLVLVPVVLRCCACGSREAS